MDASIAGTQPLRPALASIPDACRYLGGISRAALYKDYIAQLETVHLGTRCFVVVASMDRLIEARKSRSAPNADQPATEPQPAFRAA